MAAWVYRCYSAAEPSPWEIWFCARNRRDQAKHDAVFDILEQQPSQLGWKMPYVRKLKGKGTEIWEVRLTTDVAWRVFGYFSAEHEFTVTGFGNHKDNIYSPANIIEKSRSRRTEIEQTTLEAKPCARPKTP